MKPKGKRKSLAEIEYRDLRRTCFHEAGHCIIGQHYGADVRCNILRASDPSIQVNSWTGQTDYGLWGCTDYQHAVASWAGNVSGFFFEMPLDEWQSHIDTFAYDLWMDFEIGGGQISPSDQEGILPCSESQQQKTLERACKLVIAKRKAIAQFAEQMIARYSPEIARRYT